MCSAYHAGRSLRSVGSTASLLDSSKDALGSFAAKLGETELRRYIQQQQAIMTPLTHRLHFIQLHCISFLRGAIARASARLRIFVTLNSERDGLIWLQGWNLMSFLSRTQVPLVATLRHVTCNQLCSSQLPRGTTRNRSGPAVSVQLLGVEFD
jgi:hypothetical protein